MAQNQKLINKALPCLQFAVLILFISAMSPVSSRTFNKGFIPLHLPTAPLL
jgi:hypothetical protein